MSIRERAGRAVVLLVATLAPVVLLAQMPAQKPAKPSKIERVKDNLYVLTGEGGNVAVYVTNGGVVVVDDMFYRNHDDIVAQVATVSNGQPIKYVLNTHQHDDHAGGNAKMLRIATVIAQENVRKNLEHIKQPYYEDTPGTPIGLPTITFSRELAVNVGGKEVRTLYFGRGHTSGDAVVYFPLKVIHTGDLFLSFPRPPDKPPGAGIYVDYAQGGSFLEWTDTLDRVLALDFDVVIPGHGPVATRQDVVKFRANVAAMRDRIQGLVKSGASKQQVLTVFEMDYGWKSTGCPASPPTGGCLQFQQMDSLIDELRR